jgi:hypothetical protein
MWTALRAALAHVSSYSLLEPTMWALMLAGFTAAALAFRRRRRILAPQIALRRAESGVAPWHDMRRRNP